MYVCAVFIAGWLCALVGGLVVLFMTWHKTYASYRTQCGGSKELSLLRVIFYNGTCLFFIVTAVVPAYNTTEM